MIAPNGAFVDKLKIEFNDGLIGIEGEDATPSVPDGRQIAGWVYFFYFHPVRDRMRFLSAFVIYRLV